ncbi:MAG: histidine kinase N-terminal 7TM domain-containing protein [Anaerolineae bacterium]
MQRYHTIVIVADIIATCVTASLGLYAWRRRGARGAIPFMFFMFSVAWWMFTNALYLASQDVLSQLFWRRAMFLAVDAAPITWLCLALVYAGYDAWRPRNVALLSIVPLATTVVHWIRDADPSYVAWLESLNLSHIPPPLYMPYDMWFVVHAVYGYCLVLLGTVILIRTVVRSAKMHRWQAIAVIIGAIVPLVSDLPMTLGWISLPGFETAPFALTVTSVFWTYGLFRYHLFEIVPAAYHAVVTNLPDGLVVLDTQERIVELNPAAEQLLHARTQSAIGEAISHYLPEWPTLQTHLRCGADQSDVTIVLKNGTAGQPGRYVNVRMTPVLDRHGRLRGHILLLRDVDHRVRLENALRQRTAQLSALSRLVLELSTELSLPDLLRFIVEQSVHLLGGIGAGLALYRPERDAMEWAVVLSLKKVDPLPNIPIQRGKGLMGIVWETGQPLVLSSYSEWSQCIVTSSDGVPIEAAVAVPMRWSGEMLGVLGVVSDKKDVFSKSDADLLALFAAYAGIAIRNAQLVESLRNSERRFRELADALPDTVFETDRYGMLTFLNRCGCDTFGYTPAELKQGIHILKLLAPEERHRAWREWQAAIATGDAKGEFIGMRKDGSTFSALVHSISVVSNESVSGYRGIVVDITDRKQMEEELQRSLREKETLLREIHHRVKNNLQTVASLLYLQAEVVRDEQVRRALAESQQRVRSLALLHEQLYRLHTLAAVNFSQYIETLIYQLRDVYHLHSGIKVVHCIEDVPLSLDAAIPCSLIANELVSNAFKHAFPRKGDAFVTTGGDPEVRIEFGCPKPGEFRLVVRDNGVGLPADLSIETAASLGLRIVSLLTRQLHGTLRVERDGGTTVMITFPVKH